MADSEVVSGTFPTQEAAQLAVSELRRLGYGDAEIHTSAEGGQVRIVVSPHDDTRARAEDVLQAGQWAAGAGWRGGEARRANGFHDEDEKVTTDHTGSTDWTTGTGPPGQLPGG